jgi:ABC-type polysaccharide/polyol phosphate transport system ATPase subunit
LNGTDEQDKPVPLWVLGMHRSGTSLYVRALERHAVQLPPNLLPAAADNPDGFQESADLVALNDALLAAAGCQWDGSWPLQPSGAFSLQSSPLHRGLNREIKRLLKAWCVPQSCVGPGLLALKDPRLCRTLPRLIETLGREWLQFGTAIVREPCAVIASIGYRDDMPPLKALALWLRYNLDLVRNRALEPLVGQWPLLSFERLIAAPEAELAPCLQRWRAAGLAISRDPREALILRELAAPPRDLPDLPAPWLALARRFHQVLASCTCLAEVPEATLHDVQVLLDETPALSQQLLALEAQRREHLGRMLAAERRGHAETRLLGENDLPALEQASAEHVYVELQQVCIDLRDRDQRRSLRRLLRPQAPSGLRPLALDHLDLKVGHGERIGLLGHNGSGKTTLLRLLGGIYEPTGGRIVRDGAPLAPVIEQSLGFSQELTGLQLARYSHRLHRSNQQNWDDYLAELEAFTELGDALATPIKTWSLGMRTRLSFALITFRDVQGLALDEGLAAGDQWFQRKARRHLDQFIDRAGTVVLASHSEDLLRRYCTRGLILERGRLRFDGSLYRALQLYRGQLH